MFLDEDEDIIGCHQLDLVTGFDIVAYFPQSRNAQRSGQHENISRPCERSDLPWGEVPNDGNVAPVCRQRRNVALAVGVKTASHGLVFHYRQQISERHCGYWFVTCHEGYKSRCLNQSHYLSVIIDLLFYS